MSDQRKMMKISYIGLTAALAFFTASGQAQTKSGNTASKAKAAAKAPAVTVAELVTQGRIAEAVKLAAKSPGAAQSAMNSLMSSADAQIVVRKTAEAQAILDSAQKFVDAYDKTGKMKELPRDALKGRQVRLQAIEFSNQGDYAKSEAFLRQALKISKDAKDPVLEAAVHNNLGYALQSMDLLEEAVKEYDTARLMADEQNDNARSGTANFNLGETLYKLKRLDPALAAFKRAAEKGRAASRPDIEALAIRKQAIVMGALDPHNAEAIRVFQEAETMFEKIGDHQNAGLTYHQMGESLAYNMSYRQAAEYGEKALTLLTKANHKPSLQRCLEFLGDMYGRLGDIPTAEKYRKQAKELEAKKPAESEVKK
jgi:tetratricopeptide (TPR) repeat protein